MAVSTARIEAQRSKRRILASFPSGIGWLSMAKRGTDHSGQLPVEVLLHVWRELPYQMLVSCEQVCCLWRMILSGVDGDQLWQQQALALWQTKQPPLLPPTPLVAQQSWKQQFAFRLQDSRRRCLTSTELSCANWRFRFRQCLEQFHMTNEEREEHRAREPAKLTFDLDGYYTSIIPGAPSSTRPLRWQLVTMGNGCESVVQIGGYPLLRIDRTPDWGWRMQNRFVEFFTESETRSKAS